MPPLPLCRTLEDTRIYAPPSAKPPQQWNNSRCARVGAVVQAIRRFTEAHPAVA